MDILIGFRVPRRMGFQFLYRHIWIGYDLLLDDVVCHEFTHGVSDYESHLFFEKEPGAIDESFSDMWGEWFDQTYAYDDYGYDDDDSPGSKWLIAEDLTNSFRDMADPPQKNDPDRYKGPNWSVSPTGH